MGDESISPTVEQAIYKDTQNPFIRRIRTHSQGEGVVNKCFLKGIHGLILKRRFEVIIILINLLHNRHWKIKC